MSVAAIMMAKDEADVIEHTVTHLLGQVDAVMIADNGSSDGTREILDALPVTVLDDDEPAYYQARKMSDLATLAAESGADWVVPVDADEWWYSPFGRIADVLEASDAAVEQAALFDHVATGQDADIANPFTRIRWRRREQAALPKVAARARPAVRIHQGNHGADFGPTGTGKLVVRHFPYRSIEQFVKKVRNGAAAYAATDLPESQGQHWRDYGRLLESGGEDALAEVFRSWFWVADPAADSALILDPAP